MSHRSCTLVVGCHANTRRRDRSVRSTTTRVSPAAMAGTTPTTRAPRSSATHHAAPVRRGRIPGTEHAAPSTATAREVDDGRRRPVVDSVILRGAARRRLRPAAPLPGSDNVSVARCRAVVTPDDTAPRVLVLVGGRRLATVPRAPRPHRDATGDALPRLPPLPVPPRTNPVDNAPPTTYRRSRRRNVATRKKTTVRWLPLQSLSRTIRTVEVRSVAGNTRTVQSLAARRRS